MKPVVLGMEQPYPGYSCEQVTIVACRILDTIVASGQTRHNIKNALREIRLSGVDWIELARDMNRWWAPLSTAINPVIAEMLQNS
jgi:hypothetical protein